MAENYTTAEGMVTDIQRAERLSANGNPHYQVTLTTGSYATMRDASINYGITNPEWQGTPVVVTLERNLIVGIRTQDGRHSNGPQG